MNAHSPLPKFQRFYALGYRHLVPILPPLAPISESSSFYKGAMLGGGKDKRGKAVGIKRSDGKWMGFDWIKPVLTTAAYDSFDAMGAGLGIKTGRQADTTYLLGFDADTPDESQAKIVADTVARHFGRLAVRVGRHPKALYLLRVAVAFPYTMIEFEQPGGGVARVEVLADGKQFVAEGIHPATMQPYTWPRGVPALADVPLVTPGAVLAALEDLRGQLPAAKPLFVEGGGGDGEAVDQDKLIGDLALMREAIDATPNTSETFPRRGDYVKFGYGIKAGLRDHPDEALALFTDWADKWVGPNGETNDPESDWRRMKPPFRVGADYVFWQAELHSGGVFNRWYEDPERKKADPVDDAVPNEWVAASAGDAPGDAADVWVTPYAVERPYQATGLFKPLNVFAAEYTPLEYAIEPYVRTGSLYTLTAKTGAGKTAWMISAAIAVVTGRGDILNMSVEAGRVAYLCFENPDDIRMRFMIAAQRFGVSLDDIGDRLMIIDARVKPEVVEAELKLVMVTALFRLVFVDTLAAFFDGDNINDAVQGGQFVRRIRPWTRLAGLPAVVIAAHPVKNAGEEQLVPYGSGAILNEVDGNLTLWLRPEKTVSFHWQGKLRGLDFPPAEFRFDIADSPDVLDAKSRLVKLPIMVPAEAVDVEVRADAERDRTVALLRTMIAAPGAKQSAWAMTIGCSQTLVNRRLKRLGADKLATETLGRWTVTAKGEKLANAEAESPPRRGVIISAPNYTPNYTSITCNSGCNSECE